MYITCVGLGLHIRDPLSNAGSVTGDEQEPKSRANEIERAVAKSRSRRFEVFLLPTKKNVELQSVRTDALRREVRLTISLHSADLSLAAWVLPLLSARAFRVDTFFTGPQGN